MGVGTEILASSTVREASPQTLKHNGPKGRPSLNKEGQTQQKEQGQENTGWSEAWVSSSAEM